MNAPAHCPNTERCPLYPQFALGCLADIWKVRYCQNPRRFESCQRYVRGKAGQRVPPNLLPDGELLKTAM